MKRRAFAYLRVSGLGQVDGLGFDRQLTAIQRFAHEHDIEIVRIYREEGIPGKNELDDRPSLRSLIADLLSDGVKLVLVERLDRLARALIVQETILQDLQRRGIEMISVAEPDACSADPTRTMIRQILGAFFEYERKMIVSKLADARSRIRLKNGKCEGRKAYGEHPNKPAEKLVLDRMRRMSADGFNWTSIARELNGVGIEPRKGKQWHPATIGRILRRAV
jgi:DNA invertase Pin-like site-specific DNA recombinase